MWSLTCWHASTNSSRVAPDLLINASTRSLNNRVNCSYNTVYLPTTHNHTPHCYEWPATMAGGSMGWVVCVVWSDCSLFSSVSSKMLQLSLANFSNSLANPSSAIIIASTRSSRAGLGILGWGGSGR